MRHTIRPFVRVLKNRSSKLGAPRPFAVDMADRKSAKPTLVESADAAGGHRDGYRAVLKEADALFGKSSSAAPAEQATTPNPPSGRVLPSLIPQDDALTVRLREAAEKSRRGGKGKKIAAAAPAPSTKSSLPPEEEMAPIFVKPAASAPTGEDAPDSAALQEHPAPRGRWMHKSEFKPGEKWKRRLCKAAR